MAGADRGKACGVKAGCFEEPYAAKRDRNDDIFEEFDRLPARVEGRSLTSETQSLAAQPLDGKPGTRLAAPTGMRSSRRGSKRSGFASMPQSTSLPTRRSTACRARVEGK